MILLVEGFFTTLENIVQNINQISTDNQVPVMHLLAKIFYVANNVSLLDPPVF